MADTISEKPEVAPATVPETVVDQHSDMKHLVGTHDIGAQLYEEVQQYDPAELEAESDQVRRLIDWNIMPIVC